MSKTSKEPTESTEGLKTNLPPRVQTISIEKIPKASESQSITINLFASPYPKVDRPVQTDPSVVTVDLHDCYSRPYHDSVDNQADTLTTASEYQEAQNLDDFCGTSSRKSVLSISDEIGEDKSMDVRKQHPEAGKNALIARATSDLERRKLEAELKATEEIAKIQQTVIEKRLAYELASIQGDPDFQPNARSPLHPQADLAAYEDWAARKQKIIEKNLALELDSLSRASAPRPPLPPRPNVMDVTKRKISRPEIIVNRTVNPPDRREIGFRTTDENEYRSSNTTNVAGSQEVRYITPAGPRFPNRMEEPSLSFARPGQSVGNATLVSDYKNISIWRTVLAKVKRRFRSSKSSGPWE